MIEKSDLIKRLYRMKADLAVIQGFGKNGISVLMQDRLLKTLKSVKIDYRTLCAEYYACYERDPFRDETINLISTLTNDYEIDLVETLNRVKSSRTEHNDNRPAGTQ